MHACGCVVKKNPRVKLDPRKPTAARLKKNPCKTRPAHACGCAVKKKHPCKTRTAHACGCAVKKKALVKLEPRTPTAARLKINRRQSKKPPSLRLRDLTRKIAELAQTTCLTHHKNKKKQSSTFRLHNFPPTAKISVTSRTLLRNIYGWQKAIKTKEMT